ncbi:helix-turn-helix transcriptional regulator [Veillonella sp.]|uniref:helix-turn-helix domain-containing protein n=1 Tax=Veillonella sp. TaxID=1926307 RepID=UPI0025D85C5D|nr:helix-turn-helix transcriptional regulator [Veillonella sp.]
MNFTNLDTLGDRIKAIRISKGLTQEDFANLLGASKGNVSVWESNKNKPNNTRLKKIADIGGVSITELLFNHKEEEIFSDVKSMVEYFLEDEEAFAFKISVLIGELEEPVGKMRYPIKSAILKVLYSYIDEDIRNELLLMIAEDINGQYPALEKRRQDVDRRKTK